jgi:hypothetical protein
MAISGAFAAKPRSQLIEVAGCFCSLNMTGNGSQKILKKVIAHDFTL